MTIVELPLVEGSDRVQAVDPDSTVSPGDVMTEIQNGNDRLLDLYDALPDGVSEERLAWLLAVLVKQGYIALLPIGDAVVIREESKTP